MDCGIFGICGHPESSKITYLGLHGLQHRGQESSGIVSSDGERLYPIRQMGLVADIFTEEVLEKLPGHMAIGHNRYSTTGTSELKNAQPFVVEHSRGGLAVSHNGNLVNAHLLREELESYGSIFQSNMDTEVIVHLMATSRAPTLLERIITALQRVKGAYSILFLTEHALIAARDPFGFRPLVLGSLKGSYVFASETCALDLIEAHYEREVEPGEIIMVSDGKFSSIKPFKEERRAQCIFEYIYFARPDSIVYGRNVNEVRKQLGMTLATERPADADIVIPVPDSGLPAAIGYASKSGLPFETGLIRNHYIGRTFIEPEEGIRHFGVKIKLNPSRETLKGKRAVVVDDSIVRGTTSRKIVKMILDAGAREVHMRISSPPTTHSCFYGIDTPTREELIASTHSVEEICRFIGADTLGYMSHEGLLSVVGKAAPDFCRACFSGKYPVEIPMELRSPQLALFEPSRIKEIEAGAAYAPQEQPLGRRAGEAVRTAAKAPDSFKERLLELLRQRAYEKRDVVLSSGKKSNFYIDCKQVSLDAEGAYLVGKLLFELIKKTHPSTQAVGGLTLGADPLITAISIISRTEGSLLPGFIVRKEAKSHGTSAWIEGAKNLVPGTRVAIVEDVVTTGESALKAIMRAKEAGFTVTGVYSLVDRLEGGREAIEKAGYPLFTLFTREDFPL